MIMKCLTFQIALFVAVTMTKNPRSGFHVNGFSTLSALPCFRIFEHSEMDITCNKKTKRETMVLLGILDDIMEGGIDDDQEGSDGSDKQELVELYHSLIFASDLQSEISNRLEEFTDPRFLEYLNSLSESSQDKQEREGLTELIGRIDDAKTAMAMNAADDQEKAMNAAKVREELEKESTSENSTKRSKPLSNADVLRKANEIDAAIALSDEEKPSDFISDCREVVNLSRGFNDNGQMRVGG